MGDLFADAARERMQEIAPLALRLRPRSLDEFVGQAQVLGEGSALRLAMATVAPSLPSARATASPMPVPPPVTMAVCPASTGDANMTLKCTARCWGYSKVKNRCKIRA